MFDAGREGLVCAAFVGLADTFPDHNPTDVFDRLIAYIVAMLAVDGATIMLDPAAPAIVAASSEDAGLMALLELELADGPGIDCLTRMAPISALDLMSAQQRWPRFADAAARVGDFLSVDALPLRLRSDAVGVLIMFRRTSGPMPAADLALAQAMADVATTGLLANRAIQHGEARNDQLQTALTSRIVIEQAKGMLAHSAGVSVGTAFDLLRGYARSHNMKLHEVARRVVARDLSVNPLLKADDTPRDRR